MERCQDGGKHQNRKVLVFVFAQEKWGGRGKREKRQHAAEVRRQEIRERPDRRDVVELCLQARDTQCTAAL